MRLCLALLLLMSLWPNQPHAVCETSPPNTQDAAQLLSLVKKRVTPPRSPVLTSLADSLGKTYTSSYNSNSLGQLSLQERMTQWNFASKVFSYYYSANHNNNACNLFARELYELFNLSYPHRSEIGGWAGGFVRETFFYAALDIVKRWEFWCVPFTENEFVIAIDKLKNCILIGAVVGAITDVDLFKASLAGAAICTGYVAAHVIGTSGNHHFESHLAPAFFNYIRREFRNAVRESTPQNVRTKLKAKMDEIIKEHDNQLERALKPSFDRVFPPPSQALAKDIIPTKARNLRFNTFRTALMDLREEGLVDESIATSMLDQVDLYQNVSPNSSSSTFTVESYLDTHMRVERGDLIQITAEGRLLLGPFVGKAGPEGIKPTGLMQGLEVYNIVPGLPHGALLVRVRRLGNEPWILAGQATSFRASNSGVLEITVNDIDLENNVGFLTVSVKRNR